MYSVEKNVLMLITLLKEHNIKRIIASPGATNVCFIASVQNDPFFEIYSCVDERSAAYIACGLAAESGEPVALSCTGATASRNYVPGLTEAFYRKLPVLAVTSSMHMGKVGQNVAQMIDRSVQMKDLVKFSAQIDTIYSLDDEWACNLSINAALLELRHRGGGPVHINLVTEYSPQFNIASLPVCRVIHRYEYGSKLPDLESKTVGIFVGAHKRWDEELTQAVDRFCEKYNGVVFCDHTSNYCGNYRVMPAIVTFQTYYEPECKKMDVMIYIGDISGAYIWLQPKEVWRVNPDGEIRDNFKITTNVFEMQEKDFFLTYSEMGADRERNDMTFYKKWKEECEKILSKIPDLPFSNIWIAQKTLHRLPENSVLYLGILNSLRAWNFFEKPESIEGYSNTGGFGIDGILSSLIGASFFHPEKLYYVVIGDLAFFYDMNALGNRHVGNNIRIMLINNGRGTEFRNYNHSAAAFGKETDKYIAAAGHFGNKSCDLVRHYASDLGYEYFSASSKEEYMEKIQQFLLPQRTDKSMIFEVFTDSEKESEALQRINEIEIMATVRAKKTIKQAIGPKGIEAAKKLLDITGALGEKDKKSL